MKDLNTLKNMMYQLHQILDKRQRRQMVGMFFVILLGSMLELLGVSIIMPFIQAMLDPVALAEKSFIAAVLRLFHIPANQVILAVGIGIIIVYLVKNGYILFSDYLQVVYSCKTRQSLSTLLLKAYMHRPYTFFTNSNSGEIINGVINDVNQVYSLMQNFFKFLSEGMIVVLIAVYLAITDIRMSFGILITGIICLIIIVFGLKRYLSRLGKISRIANIASHKWIVQSVEGIKDIFVFEKRNFFYNSYSKAYGETTRSSAAVGFAQQIPERLIEACCVAGMIVTVLLRMISGENANEFVPTMAAFAMAAFRLLPSISRITGYISFFIYVRPSIEAAYESITAARKEIDELSAIIAEKPEEKTLVFHDTIRIDCISWKYDDAPDEVLHDLSLDIRKGESIGIIGESGSGKSTLGNILLNLFVPEKGKIYMDGIDISTIPYSWHKNIAYVPQDVFLMDATIRENVAFGETNINDEKVWKMLEQASLAQYVRGLPDGLNTIVGERGIKFSGGQRQRIAIARALYFEPQILLLDEATSALDNETESAVMESIDALQGKMTLIIIAHRLSTLNNCDRIIEIVDGKAIQQEGNIDLLGRS